MLDGMVVRRALGDVKIAELVRRALVVGGKLFLPALVPLLLLWLPVVAACLVGPYVIDLTREEAGVALLAGQGLLSAFSILTAPALSAALASAAIRTGGGARLSTRDVLGSIFGAPKSAWLASLAVGVLTLLGLGALVIPGLFATAVWFVVGPSAAVERLGFSAALRRSAELTRGNRWVLLGAALFLGALERILLRFADVFFSERGRQSDVPFDLLVPLLVSMVVIAFVTVLRATTAALAYNDLRVTSEGLEIDALVVELGGAGSSLAEAALSAREIDAMEARRKLVGKLTGQSDAAADPGAAASVRDLEIMARDRDRRTRRIGMIVGGIAAAGIVAAISYSIVLRRQQSSMLDEQEKDIVAAWAAVESKKPADGKGDDSNADGDPLGDDVLGFGSPGAGRLPNLDFREKLELGGISGQIASHVARVPGPQQKAQLYRLMVPHAPHLYGEGFAKVFEALRDGASGDALLPLLEPIAKSAGCADRLAEVRALPDKQARAFAEGCPGHGVTALHPTQVDAKMPLASGVLATLASLVAKRRGVDKDPAHDLVMKSLVPSMR